MSTPLRPRGFALLLLASVDRPARQRARDQRPDVAGAQLKCTVLERLAELDPDPEELERALLQIVQESQGPSGPVRAIALAIREDWRAACGAPEWVDHLQRAAEGAGAGEEARG